MGGSGSGAWAWGPGRHSGSDRHCTQGRCGLGDTGATRLSRTEGCDAEGKNKCEGRAE